jgi:hypothetical protein
MSEKKNRTKLACGHYFHIHCLAQCQKAEYPMCRATFYVDEAYDIYENTVIKQMIKDIFTMYKNIHVLVFNCLRMCIVFCNRGERYVNVLTQFLSSFYKNMSKTQRINKVLMIITDFLEH